MSPRDSIGSIPSFPAFVAPGFAKSTPQLFTQWSHKEAGCGIVCLSQRPDVAALRRFSKTLRRMYQEDLAELLKWFFVAHRQGMCRLYSDKACGTGPGQEKEGLAGEEKGKEWENERSKELRRENDHSKRPSNRT